MSGASDTEWGDPYGEEDDDSIEEEFNIDPCEINTKGYRESDASSLRPEVIKTIEGINEYLCMGLDSCI